MKKQLLSALLICATTAAAAQSITGSLHASHDSDSFEEWKEVAAYTGKNGWGIKATGVQYASPGWSARGTSISGTYASRSDLMTLEGSLGLARIAHHDILVGAFDFNQPLGVGQSWGVSVERDVVNSQLGLQKGLSYTAVALVGDHAFGEKFNVGISAGITQFSNDNRRAMLRTRWNYSLSEAHGFNVYVKTRSYQNSSPYRPEYFSPDRLNEASIGLSARMALTDHIVINASLDAGRQKTDANSQPIWSALVGLSSARKDKVQWKVGIEATNSSSSLLSSQADSYRYVSAVAQITVPF